MNVSNAAGGYDNTGGTVGVSSGGSLSVAGNLTNTGIISFFGTNGGSTGTVGGNVNNAAGGIFTVLNDGNALLGAQAKVTVAGNLNNFGSTLLSGKGPLAIGKLTVSGTVNGNAVTIGPFGDLDPTTYTQTAGSTTVATNGTLTAASININGGTLQGTGTINGNVTNAAITAPGNETTSAPGALTVNGNYTQQSSGELDILFGGSAGVSQLDLSGTADLDGMLNAVTVDGFEFNASELGDTWIVADAATGVSGNFTELELNGVVPAGSTAGLTSDADPLGAGLFLDELEEVPDAGEIVLELEPSATPVPTPEAPAWLLMIIGLAALAVPSMLRGTKQRGLATPFEL